MYTLINFLKNGTTTLFLYALFLGTYSVAHAAQAQQETKDPLNAQEARELTAAIKNWQVENKNFAYSETCTYWWEHPDVRTLCEKYGKVLTLESGAKHQYYAFAPDEWYGLSKTPSWKNFRKLLNTLGPIIINFSVKGIYESLTILSYAEAWTTDDFNALLKVPGIDVNVHYGQVLRTLAGEHAEKKVKLLLEYGAKKEYASSAFLCLFFRKQPHALDYGRKRACPEKLRSLIDMLLQHGADINAKTWHEDKGTALIWAGRMWFDIEILIYLLAWGADPSIQDHYKQDFYDYLSSPQAVKVITDYFENVVPFVQQCLSAYANEYDMRDSFPDIMPVIAGYLSNK